MSIGQQAFGAVICVAVALVAWSVMLYALGRRHGRADAALEQRAVLAQRRIRANRERQARTTDAGGATASHAGTGAAAGVQRSTDRSPRVGPPFPPARPRRHAVTAEHIAPVITGPFPAAVTLPPPAAARTTGELRLIAKTDRWIADMTAAENAYRQELTQ